MLGLNLHNLPAFPSCSMMREREATKRYPFALRHESMKRGLVWPSTDALNYLFYSSKDPIITTLSHLLVVATDFVCSPELESSPTCWKAMKTPYITWLKRLHRWRSGTGLLAIDILHSVLDGVGHGENESAYHETKRTASHLWLCICEITRDVSSLTVPGADLITFRHRCTTWLLLVVQSWDSLRIAVADDMKALSALSQETDICRRGTGDVKSLRNLLKEGVLFKEDFDEKTFRSVVLSLGPIPHVVVNHSAKGAGLLVTRTKSKFPSCLKNRRGGLYLKAKL